MTYLLASASPRRKALMEQAGLTPLRILPGNIDESVITVPSPAEKVKALALLKGHAVLASIKSNEVIIAADTVVVFGDKVMGKPHSRHQAYEMLSLLSGQTHSVLTGLAVLTPQLQVTEAVETHVTFRSLSEREINSYIATGEPFDKAGGYGIQGRAASFVSSIVGDYFSVVGLPLCRLCEILNTFFPGGSS